MSHKRLVQRRRLGKIKPAVIEARRRYLALEDAVKACKEKRDAAYKRAWDSDRDYAEYHRLAPPCGETCACQEQQQADTIVVLGLPILPWEYPGGEEQMAELDRLAKQTTEGIV